MSYDDTPRSDALSDLVNMPSFTLKQNTISSCYPTSVMFYKQVRIHEISRDSSNLCPPCRSDTPLAASGSILRIFSRPKKMRYGWTDQWTDRRTDG